MVRSTTKSLVILGLCGTLTTALPLTSSAQTTESSRWNQGQAELQKQLMPGMAADSYRQKLEQMGYKVTSTNYNSSDYLEYEVVKGDQSWEIQIDVDENTRKATSVDIAQNVWRTDATSAALDQAQTAARAAGTGAVAGAGAAGTATTNQRTMNMRTNQYSDRDRASTDQLVRELDALPVGQNKDYYKNALRQRGYEITRINTDDNDELQLEAVKNGNSVQLEVSFDEDSARSTAVDASSLWAESESTTRAREAQDQSQSSTGRSSLNRYAN